MLVRVLLLLTVMCQLLSAVVVDRVAIIVGRRVVKTSDIERDLRVTQFVNRQPLNLSAEAKRGVADRMITQELIRQELMNGGYTEPGQDDVTAYLQQLRNDRFKGSEEQLHLELSRYGLSEPQLRQYLLWQLTVLRFIDQRFRPGVLVTDEDVRDYYDEHHAEMVKANPAKNSLQELDPKIRETISGERVNKSFEEWLQQTKERTRVEYREAAFEGTLPK